MGRRLVMASSCFTVLKHVLGARDREELLSLAACIFRIGTVQYYGSAYAVSIHPIQKMLTGDGTGGGVASRECRLHADAAESERRARGCRILGVLKSGILHASAINVGKRIFRYTRILNSSSKAIYSV
jgi:hypothetical protein